MYITITNVVYTEFRNRGIAVGQGKENMLAISVTESQ